MGKEFIEYQTKNGTIPYSTSSLCFYLTEYAKKYISCEGETISKIDKNVRDAVLVDSINYLAMQGGVDFALYTTDLYKKEKQVLEVDAQCVLTAVPNHYAYYINNGIVESVLRNKFMNECTEPFDEKDGATVLLDFINFISKNNGYDKRFTMTDLYNKFKKQEHNKKLKELKLFLEQTSFYYQKLQNGENIDSIFNQLALNFNLKSISKDGKYFFNDKMKEITGQSEMTSWLKNDVESDIYAMAYAYDKLALNKEKPTTEIIIEKIKEMKKI